MLRSFHTILILDYNGFDKFVSSSGTLIVTRMPYILKQPVAGGSGKGMEGGVGDLAF
jgi:hypothetical protein